MNTTTWIPLFLAAALAPRAPAVTAPHQEAQAFAVFDHGYVRWNAVLARGVRGDQVDYRALLAASAELDQALLAFGDVRAEDFATWTREQRYAFWINAYNAYALQLVVSRYPLKSIRDLGTLISPVWKKKYIPLGHLVPEKPGEQGSLISLDTLEHGILRPVFEDARVHAAINCASESCPPLRATAYTAEDLDRQLDAQVRSWLADTERNRFVRDARRLELSAIFEWFEPDFVRDAGSVEGWVARYAPPDQVAWLLDGEKVRITHLPYSWKLNDVPPPEGR